MLLMMKDDEIEHHKKHSASPSFAGMPRHGAEDENTDETLISSWHSRLAAGDPTFYGIVKYLNKPTSKLETWRDFVFYGPQ